MTHRSGASLVVVLSAFSVLGLGGCLGMGGCGGDPVSTGLLKVASGQMTQLNTEEIKALAQTFSAQEGVSLPAISDAEAQAVIDFLNANGIDTIDQALALLQDPSGVTIPPSVLELIRSLVSPVAPPE